MVSVQSIGIRFGAETPCSKGIAAGAIADHTINCAALPHSKSGEIMKLYRMVAATIATGLLVALTAASTAQAATRPQAAACVTNWGTQTKAGGLMHTPALLDARAGKHTCYDRIVFEYAGLATGYRIGYASQVYSEGQGLALGPYTAGGALMSFSLRNPAYDSAGNTTYHHAVGDHVVNVVGFRTLRDIVYGGSFEGVTQFAVGVRAKLPFRVSKVAGPGSHTRIVVDIAHTS